MTMESSRHQEPNGQPSASELDVLIEETERWFVRQGVPHFIADYTATEKVLPRMIPVLTLSFLVSVFATVNREWPLWRNTVAILVSFFVLVGIWAAVNRVRGLPALRLPETVGPVEVGVFLFGPAVLNVLTRNPGAVVPTILGNAVQLVFIYYSTSYGLVPTTFWNFRRVVDNIDLAFRLVARTFPILLLAVTFLLFSGPAWETLTITPLPRYAALLVLFSAITLLFVYQSVTSEFHALSPFNSSDEFREYYSDSPVGNVPVASGGELPQPPTLSKRERTNVFLMAMYGIWGYVMVVMVAVLVFFVLFGLLAIPAGVLTDLVGRPVDPLITVTFFDAPVSLTRELLRMSGFVAVFSGLYLTVHAMTDQAIRERLDGDVREQVRKAMAVRAVYHALRERESASR